LEEVEEEMTQLRQENKDAKAVIEEFKKENLASQVNLYNLKVENQKTKDDILGLK
jgi:hypothetical protein